MDLSILVWLILVIAALVTGYLLGSRRPAPAAPAEPTQRIREAYSVPAEGGAVHFVDEQTDVTIQVPQQKVPRALVFQNYTPSEDLLTPAKNPTGEKIIRLLFGISVTDSNGAVKHFDPALTLVTKYTAADLATVDGDPNRLIRLLHDGVAWRRLPMPQASRNAAEMTLTALTESFSDCGIGAG